MYFHVVGTHENVTWLPVSVSVSSGKYSGIAGVVLACTFQAQGQVPMAKDTCKCNSDQPGETREENGRLGESG